MEKYLVEKVHETMSDLKAELDNPKGEYLLTQVCNIENIFGHYFAYIKMLDDFTTEAEWKCGGTPEWCKLHDQYEALRRRAFEYVNECYGKLKEV